MRPVKQMKQAAMEYPIQTQSHDCHHERPFTIIDDEIIQVLLQKKSANHVKEAQIGAGCTC